MNDLPSTAGDRLVGLVIAGKYELLAKVGSGGMGAVYRARSRSHQGIVAVKLLRADLGESPEALKRFQTEARNGAALAHPNTVRVMDFGADGDLLYLVMEFLEGRSLSAVLAEQGPLPWRRAVRIATQVLKSLREAHDRRIVHRDIKPSNLMLLDLPGDPDFVKVVDLGVSRSLEATGAGTKDALGTPAYIAPEQWRVEDIDARTDLYSLGCVLYEMLAGRPPFVAGSFAGYYRLHVETPPPEPRGLMPADTPLDLVDLVLALLAKRPADRPASAAAVLASLVRVRPDRLLGDAREASAGGRPMPAADVRTATAIERPDDDPGADDWPRPRRRWIFVAVAAAVAAAGAVVIATWPPSGTGNPIVEPAADAAPRPVEVVPADSGPEGDVAIAKAPAVPVCVLGPSGDLSMFGAWRNTTPPARALLQRQGFVVDCDLPYVRGASRFGAASSKGLVQHDGTDPDALRRLLEVLRTLYPDIGAQTVDRRRLFRQFDVLVPDRSR